MSIDKAKKVDPAQNSESCFKDRREVIEDRVSEMGGDASLSVGSSESFIVAGAGRDTSAIARRSKTLVRWLVLSW